MTVVNIGILAHIDAGKTTLTERLLYEAGVISTVGSVDDGSTQTDSDEIERRRGITVRTAVASFMAGSTQVNLIDTPGHSEFVAEVERALRVLDGAVLVLSAVEGIQAQTRLLMKTLKAMRLPTLIFVNKIDRTGARDRELLTEIRDQLAVHVLAMNSVENPGSQAVRVTADADPMSMAEALVENDSALLDELVTGTPPSPECLRTHLAEHTAAGLLVPVFFGSARGGQGVTELVYGIRELLPTASRQEDSETQGVVFAVERARSGEKCAFLRLFKGTLRPRARISYYRRDSDGSVTECSGQISSLRVMGRDTDAQLAAGHIAKVMGLPAIRVGDWVGAPDSSIERHHFARPILETLARPRHAKDGARLHAALMSLAEQDPMIDTRTADHGHTSVLLYGEFQKEIITERLLREFEVEAVFELSQTLYLERPRGTGSAVVSMGESPLLATVGLRVEAGPPHSGNTFRRETELGALPRAFDQAIQETVRETLTQGLRGWPVTDCAVTLVRSGFDNACSTASDFRHLTPLVLMRALSRAGTLTYEPCHHFEAEVPLSTLSVTMTRLLALEAKIDDTSMRSDSWLVTGELPARQVYPFTQQLPSLTSGEGIWWSRPYGDRQISGSAPTRSRTDGNPLNTREYLHNLTRRVR